MHTNKICECVLKTLFSNDLSDEPLAIVVIFQHIPISSYDATISFADISVAIFNIKLRKKVPKASQKNVISILDGEDILFLFREMYMILSYNLIK